MILRDSGQELQELARKTAEDYLIDHNDGHDMLPCGFAWIVPVHQHKGNTREGRAEREVFKNLGMQKTHDGKYQFYISVNCQNIDAKIAAAGAVLAELNKMGISGHVSSHMD